MTTQDYLKQIGRFESMVERKQNEVHRLDVMAHGITSVAPDPNKVQTSLKGDRMSETVSKLIDAEKEVQGLVELYLSKRNYIINQIDNMPNRISYEILIDRYVEHKSFCEIAYKQRCTERWAKKQHNRALNEFETLYGAEYLENPTIFS